MSGPLTQSVLALAPPINFNIDALGNLFWQLTIDGLAYGAIYALVAVGYTLVYGVLRLINFAHSEIFMLGMFGQYAVLMLLGFAPSGNVYSEGTVLTIVYLGIAMLGGMAVSGGAAVGLERLAYRPLRKRNAPSLVFLITAIGASFVIQEFVHYVLPQLTNGELGGVNAQQPIRLVAPEEQFTLFGASVTNITLIILTAAFLLSLGTDVFVNRTKFGLAMRAVACHPRTAAAAVRDERVPERALEPALLSTASARLGLDPGAVPVAVGAGADRGTRTLCQGGSLAARALPGVGHDCRRAQLADRAAQRAVWCVRAQP